MKKIVVSIVLICCMIFGLVKIYGATSLNLSLGTTQTEVQAKGEIYLSIKLDNFSEMSNGINAYKAKIEYDKEVFEEINSSNFICQNGWFDLEYNSENGEFVAIKKVGITADEEVVQIRLNVKENANSGDTTVTIKEIVTSEGKEDIECTPKDIIINIVGDTTDDNTPGDDNTDDSEDNKDENTPGDDNTDDSEDNKDENTPGDDNTGDSEDNKDENTPGDDNTDDSEDNKDETKPDDDNNNTDGSEDNKDETKPGDDNTGDSEDNKDENTPGDDNTDDSEDNKDETKPGDDNTGDSEDNKDETKPGDDNTGDSEDNKDETKPGDDNNTDDSEDNKNENKPGNDNNTNNSGNTNSTNNVTNKTESNTTNTSSSTTTNVDNTVASTVLPSTGKKYTGVLIVLGNVVLISFAMVCYKKQKTITKKGNKGQKNILRILVIASLLVPMVTSIYAAVEYINRGDINDDNKIDYSDTKLLEQHIIGLIELSEEQIELADMNNDGQITVTDLSLLVIKVEKWLNYELEVSTVNTEKYYYEKNEEVSILLNATVNYGGRVKKVVIDNEEYDVEMLTTDEYRVQVKASEKAGIQEFKLKKALLDNDKYVELDNKVEIDILKNVPTVENYEHKDDLAKQKVTIKFDLIDDDDSIENATAILLDESNNTLEEEKVKSGSNEVKFDVEEAKTYTLKIVANYDRDTNKLKDLPESDNKFENEVLFEKDVVLVSDYSLEISNLTTYKEDIESKYFNKNEEIKLGFESSNKTELEPSSVEIEGKEYYVTKNENLYFVTLDGFGNSGIKEIQISSVTLSNGKKLDITENNTCKIDILKEKPEITDFKYQENNNGNYTVSFNLKDTEKAIQANSNIIITTEAGNEILNSNIKAGENNFEFEISANSQKYLVKVIANYDLDTNTFEESANEYKNEVLLSEEIDLGRRAIEMKDISSIEVYEQASESVEQVKSIDVSNLDVSKYIVKVNMIDMPSFYSNIKEANVENSTLKFTLDYENIVQYEGNAKQEKLEVVFGSVEKNVATGNNLSILIEKIKENPSGNFELTSDLDASEITTAYIFTDEFKGSLNGNGYTISNITKPLFNNLEGATIENLVLENVNLSGARGTVANDATNTTIENVHIKNLIMRTTINETGSFIGTLRTGSSIEECSATNIIISGSNKRTGGLVGAMANATINNCYVQGTFNCTNDGIGGITGSGENNSKITNCITALEFNLSYGPGYNGGIIGHSMNVLLTNNVSLSTGKTAYRVHGTGPHSNSSNNYELEESNLTTNASESKVITVKSTDINKEFYLNKANLDSAVWDLEDVSYTNLPSLKNADPNLKANIKTEQINKELYIPEYERIQKLESFDSNKEILYANLYKLMPFYDAKYYVLDGKEISSDNILNTKVIKEILAINKNGKLEVVLTNNNYKDLSKIKVIFEDNTTEEYTLSYNSYYGNVASYKINELGLTYNFDKYILNDSLPVISELATYIENIDYTADLDPLTEAEDSRLYRDYFNETTSKEAEEMVLKLLANATDYTLTIDNEILSTKVKNELISSGKLKEYIYAYNYYKRWYNIEIGEVEVDDIIMFKGQLFADSMTVKNIINEVMISSSNKNTNSTQNFYANNIAKYTGYSKVGEFLDYLITTIGGYSDPNDWFTDNYKGIVYEVEIEGKPEIEYRAWRQLKNRTECVLPVLTLPANSAYILSSPTQFLIGAQRIYIVNPDDETQSAELRKRVEDYAQYIKSFYTTASGYIPAERFNLYTDAQIDHRFTKKANGETEYQSAGTTEEPFHKNFNEAVGWWAAANGSAAYANGSTVFWNVYSALTSFSTWSHESGHNQDGKIFLNGNGRRGWAEDYADGNITQGGDDGGVNFNLTYNYDMSSDVTTNLTPERINTPEKIHSYYKGMFEALDFLDYIEAKAFLTLTPEEQSKVAVQVYYPNKENGTEEEKLAGDELTGYRVLDKEAFEKMNLQTMEDLWNNQIIIKPGVTDVSTVGTNKYGGATIYTRNWYQPHNDNGRPDSYSFKYLAWEMLGVAGYYDGYITYYSNVSANDLEAIRKVTNDETMTWKKYKLNRYQTMQDNWNNMQYLNADNILKQYIQALQTDAANGDRNVTTSTNVKRMNYHYLKRATDDFRADVFGTKSSVVHIKTAEEFQTLITNKPNGSYILDNDIDMSALSGERAIIAGTFTGSLDGNGYKIIGNKLPIFDNIKYSYINNLSIENSQVSTSDKEAGALSKTMYHSTLTDVHVENVSITADSRAGGIVGYSIRNFINQCSATNATVVASGNAVGAFMGEINNSYVTDCYSAGGYVKGRQDMGGFVGWADSTTINNCYSSADTESTVSSGNGGFIGQAVNTTKVKNCVAFGNVTGGYKFDGRTSANLFVNFENNYEYELATGTSNLNRTDIDFKDRITVLTKENAYSGSFYTGVLGWDSSIWEFSEEKLPTLKNQSK